jgi:hypothetical protein
MEQELKLESRHFKRKLEGLKSAINCPFQSQSVRMGSLSELELEPSQFQFIFQNWGWRFFVSNLTDYQNWNWNQVNSNLFFRTGIGGSL